VTKRALMAVVGLVVMSFVGAACSTASAPVDQIGLYYTGGPFQGTHFKKLVASGSGAVFVGFQDHVKNLPSGQRNYIISKNANEGDRKGVDLIRVPAKGVLMDFEVSVYFKLNTHTNDIPGFRGGTIRRFYEQICKKYGCDDNGGDGWNKMLDQNLRKIIETSLQEKVRPLDVGVLFASSGATSTDTDALRGIQSDIGATLKERVNSVLGGEFFCGPKFDAAKPDCPPLDFIINSAEPTDQATKDSFARIRSSQNDVESAKNKAREQEELAKGDTARQNALKQAGELSVNQIAYLNAQANLACAQNKDGHCVLVVGSSGGVQVNTGK